MLHTANTTAHADAFAVDPRGVVVWRRGGKGMKMLHRWKGCVWSRARNDVLCRGLTRTFNTLQMLPTLQSTAKSPVGLLSLYFPFSFFLAHNRSILPLPLYTTALASSSSSSFTSQSVLRVPELKEERGADRQSSNECPFEIRSFWDVRPQSRVSEGYIAEEIVAECSSCSKYCGQFTIEK